MHEASNAIDQANREVANRFDFKGYTSLSYGYQLPYGRKAKPKEGLDARQPINADKGPFFDAGTTSTGNGTTPDARNTQAAPTVTQVGNTDDAILKADTDKWRPFNSRNHNQEGQNLLFIDGSVRFEKKPIVGVNSDNIYTQMTDYTFRGSLLGNFALGNNAMSGQGPRTDTDSMIVP